MSKRLSETEIWKEQWYRELPVEYKSFWKYLCDNCDACGVWTKDIELASFQIGTRIDEKKALELFNKEKERIVVLNNGEKWFITQFVSFQYGQLSNKSPVHKKVYFLLKKQNLLNRVGQGFSKGSPTLQRERKEKDKEKDKEKEKDKDKNKNNESVIEFFNYFLLKTKKSLKLTPERKAIIEKRLNEGRTLEELKQAVDNFVLDDWPERHKFIDIIYCIGIRNKIDNLDKWLNIKPKKIEIKSEKIIPIDPEQHAKVSKLIHETVEKMKK